MANVTLPNFTSTTPDGSPITLESALKLLTHWVSKGEGGELLVRVVKTAVVTGVKALVHHTKHINLILEFVKAVSRPEFKDLLRDVARTCCTELVRAGFTAGMQGPGALKGSPSGSSLDTTVRAGSYAEAGEKLGITLGGDVYTQLN